MLSSEAGAGPVSTPRADAWLTPWRFAALLALLIAACFPNVISGLETFYYRDFGVFGYPLAVFHKEAFWRGEIPLWNPYNDCGLPFLAQWNTLTLYPLSLIYLLLPLPWSLDIFCLAHLFLAGMGMYFLAHRWTGSRLAAALGGVAFAYNGLTWHSLMWPNDIAALGWMPWVVLAADGAWREGGRRIVLAALAGAMQMLCGAPEVILITWFIVGAFWLAQFFTCVTPRTRLVLRAAVVGALVAALASAQLLPFLDLLAHSHRDSSYSDSQWAMPATGWANYLVPLFHTTLASRGVYMQHDQYWAGSYFAGVGVVALALLAVWRARHGRVWLLAALTLFSLVMALGNHGFVYTVLRKILPQLGFMRFPIKFVMLASFALPLLAAHGLAWIRSLDAGRWTVESKKLRSIGVVLLGLIAVILFLAWEFPQTGDNVKLTLLNGLRSGVFLAAILGCVALLQRATDMRRQVILCAVLLVLLWMDVFTHVPALSPTVVPKVFEAGDVRQYLVENKFLRSDAQLRFGESRAMESLAALRKMYFGGQEDPVTDVLGRREQLYDDLNLLDRIPKLDGFYSLYLREMNTVVTELYVATNDVSHLKDFLGISHENQSTNLMDWNERKSYAPLVTGGQRPVFLDDDDTLDFLFAPNFDGRQVVALPAEAKSAVHATNRADLKIISEAVSAERLDLQVAASAPAMVVVAQAWFHPWHAYVDGQRTSLWRANYAFQALEVPAGVHRVELAYEDRRFQTGCVVSLAALLGCAAAWLLPRKITSTC